MPWRFDELDLRILEELQEDGRRRFAAIARNLGTSEGTIRGRVGRLKRQGLVKFVAEVDPLRMGLTLAFAGIRVRGAPVKRAAERLAEIPEVNYIVVCVGSFDLFIEVVCADNEQLLDLLERIRSAPGVDQIETVTAIELTKDLYRFSAWGRSMDVLKSRPRPRRGS